jgi:NADH-quinone oxidoreductase subunit M
MTLHLSIMLWLPLALGAIGLVAPPKLAGRLALLGSGLALGYAITYAIDYDSSTSGLQYLTDETWIGELGISYKLGIDGLNLLLVVLAGGLWFACTAWANMEERERPRLFYFHMALAETAVLGALLAQDLALFVVFFDLMLVPFFFLTGMWGGARRVQATMKLVIYTLVGSLLMLTAAIATGVLAAAGDPALSFAFSDLAQRPLAESSQQWIFLFFAAAFLVKMPAFPLHGWMPDGYRAMPLPVLAVFSGVLSKVAAYGFLRVCLPLFPDAVVDFQMLLLLISLASILYGSAMAFTTTEARLILGYSSVAQLGFITLGIFALNPQGAQGAILQAFNHGLVVAPAFFIVALLAARAGGSQDIRDMGGIGMRAPVLATMFLIVTFATLAMPGSSNFVGEFYILLGVFTEKIVIAIVASTGVVMAAVYALRMYITATHNRTGAR